MEKEPKAEERLSGNHYLLGILWCALNCATDNESVYEIMQILEERGGTGEVWRELVNSKYGVKEASLKELKRLVKKIT